jgi:hypothetical protein
MYFASEETKASRITRNIAAQIADRGVLAPEARFTPVRLNEPLAG